MLWASIGWYSTFILSFVFSLVTARLLSPEEFGLVGLVLVIVLVAQLFADSGTRAAIVHRDDDDLADAVSTSMVAMAVAGFVGSCLIAAASGLVAAFYDRPQLFWITFAMAWLLWIFALSIVPDALIQRRMDYRLRRAVVDPLSVIGYGVTVIVCAVMGLGVWSLVIGQYVQFTTITVGCWILGRPRFRDGRASWTMYRSISRYGRGLLAANLVESVESQASPVVLGKGLGEGAVGLWGAGMRLGKMPLTGIVQVTGGVVFSALSRLRNDMARFSAVAGEALQMNAILVVPVGVTFMTIGEPLIAVVFGERWRGAGVVLQFIGFWAICLGLSDNGREILKAFGRPMLIARGAVLETVFAVAYLVALWATDNVSLWAVALGRALSGLVITAAYVVQVHRIGALDLATQWRAVRWPFAAGLAQAAAMAGLYVGLNRLHPGWDRSHDVLTGTLPALGVIAGIFLVGVGVYGAVLYVSDRAGLRRLRDNIRTSLAGRRAAA